MLPYSHYSQVPFYRRQSFFWLTYFTLAPVAIGVLLFGDVYYERDGTLRSFGVANRVVAGLIAGFFMYQAFNELFVR